MSKYQKELILELRKEYDASNSVIQKEVIKQYILEAENLDYLTDDSVIGVVNYLISLYYRTDLKYRYYPTKINRLLTIYKLCTLKYNNEALEYGFIIQSDGRMGVLPEMYSAFDNRYASLEEDGNEITEEIKEYENDKIYISREYIYIKQAIAQQFDRDFDINKELNISQESRELLELIFRKFGNYSVQELGPIIDEVVSKIPIKKPKKSYEIYGDLEMYKMFDDFINDNKKHLKHNHVFNFIKDFDRHNIDKFYNKVEDNIEPKPQENNQKQKRKSLFKFMQ